MKIQKERKSTTGLVVLAVLLVAGCIAYFCFAHYKGGLWPFEQSTSSDLQDLPKIESSNGQQENSTTRQGYSDDEDQTTPLETDGKTPSQYEGQRVDDTPAYNNEQFRIPESSP